MSLTAQSELLSGIGRDTDGVVGSRMEARPQHVILVAYAFPPSDSIGSLRPYRFYKYLKQLGHTVDVITATPQTAYTPDVIAIPEECGNRWLSAEKRPLDTSAAVERLIRATLLPGELGILWSLKVSRYCRTFLAQTRKRNVVILTTCPRSARCAPVC